MEWHVGAEYCLVKVNPDSWAGRFRASAPKWSDGSRPNSNFLDVNS
jgi:hypothetical protein